MRQRRRRYTRKEFIRTSSMGILATGIVPAVSGKLLAARAELPTAVLGSTGIRVSRLCVGAPRIEEPSVLRYALDQGITFIDTGRRYANGKNEVMVGEAVKGRRKDFVIQSKVNIDPGKGTLNSESVSSGIRKSFRASLEESLKALQTDYIDVMLFHGAGEEDVLYHDAVLESFSRAKKQGKILATGFSVHANVTGHIKRHNRDPFYDVIMLSFNPHGGYKRYSRDIRWDHEVLSAELGAAVKSGTGIIAMKTCLAGPWANEGEAEATYPGAVRWVLNQPYVHAAAVAMASFQQLDEHLAAIRS